MEIKTKISNWAYELNYKICLKELPNIEENLKVLERAIKTYKEKAENYFKSEKLKQDLKKNDKVYLDNIKFIKVVGFKTSQRARKRAEELKIKNVSFGYNKKDEHFFVYEED